MIDEADVTGTNSWGWLKIKPNYPSEGSFFWEIDFMGAMDAPEWLPAGSVRRCETMGIIQESTTARG